MLRHSAVVTAECQSGGSGKGGRAGRVAAGPHVSGNTDTVKILRFGDSVRLFRRDWGLPPQDRIKFETQHLRIQDLKIVFF